MTQRKQNSKLAARAQMDRMRIDLCEGRAKAAEALADRRRIAVEDLEAEVRALKTKNAELADLAGIWSDGRGEEMRQDMDKLRGELRDARQRAVTSESDLAAKTAEVDVLRCDLAIAKLADVQQSRTIDAFEQELQRAAGELAVLRTHRRGEAMYEVYGARQR